MDGLADLALALAAGALGGGITLALSAFRPRLRIGRVTVYEAHAHEFDHIGPGGLWQCRICPETKPRGS